MAEKREDREKDSRRKKTTATGPKAQDVASAAVLGDMENPDAVITKPEPRAADKSGYARDRGIVTQNVQNWHETRPMTMREHWAVYNAKLYEVGGLIRNVLSHYTSKEVMGHGNLAMQELQEACGAILGVCSKFSEIEAGLSPSNKKMVGQFKNQFNQLSSTAHTLLSLLTAPKKDRNYVTIREEAKKLEPAIQAVVDALHKELESDVADHQSIPALASKAKDVQWAEERVQTKESQLIAQLPTATSERQKAVESTLDVVTPRLKNVLDQFADADGNLSPKEYQARLNKNAPELLWISGMLDGLSQHMGALSRKYWSRRGKMELQFFSGKAGKDFRDALVSRNKFKEIFASFQSQERHQKDPLSMPYTWGAMLKENEEVIAKAKYLYDSVLALRGYMSKQGYTE